MSAESAIEKQPAWAAAINSSGFVPGPSSKREEKLYRPSKAPPPKRIWPSPWRRLPFHSALAVRIAMLFLLWLAPAKLVRSAEVTGFMGRSPPPINPYQAKWFDAKPLFELRAEPFDIKLSSWRHAPPNRFSGFGVRALQ